MKPKPINRCADEALEISISTMLRIGVLLSSVIVLAGGIYYLFKYGSQQPEYGVFRGEPERFRSVGGIIGAVMQLSSRGIIELGLLLLIATPIARVAFSLVSFAREKDRTYVVVTLIVLVILLFNLFVRYG
jgi:uncharacterized membrane protein